MNKICRYLVFSQNIIPHTSSKHYEELYEFLIQLLEEVDIFHTAQCKTLVYTKQP